MPVFVVTHETREPLPRRGGTTYHFVTRGLEAALADARAAADDKDVGVWGGANIVTQYLQAGLLDELQLHVVPILLGSGVRLFQDLNAAGIELRKTRSIDTPRATHLRLSILT
jgi:dihydrofolate reductase